MNSMFDKVEMFHELILGLEKPEIPTFISPEWCLERVRFMLEEVSEFAGAAMKGDMVEAADGLADIIYVALGTGWMMGLPLDRIFDHVHTCNMRKVRGVGTRGNAIDAVKPIGWIPPNQGIAKLLEDHLD